MVVNSRRSINLRMRKATALILVVVLALAAFTVPVSAADGTSFNLNAEELDNHIKATGSYLINTIGEPSYNMVGGDWTVFALARSPVIEPDGFYTTYYKNVERAIKDSKGELSRNKYSEYSRLILALTAVSKNPTNVGGYNLLERLSDIKLIEKQGINGPIYALLALDSHSYTIPSLKVAGTQTTRDLLINSILKRELDGGGFSLGDIAADPDVTAAALQALGKYKDRKEVEAVINRCLDFLSSTQTINGGFTGWTTEGMENAESIAQVVLALTSLGIDPAKDSRFIKIDGKGKKNGPLDALEAFRLPDGSYKHIEGGDADIMATEQALLALVSYQRLIDGETSIFHIAGSGESASSHENSYQYKVLLNGKHLSFDQPPINKDGRILVPMRAIFEALGAEVKWDNHLRKVTGTLGEREVKLTIGDKSAFINGTLAQLDVAATIENGRTLVPVRFISESLEAIVNWDGHTNTVIITKEIGYL